MAAKPSKIELSSEASSSYGAELLTSSGSLEMKVRLDAKLGIQFQNFHKPRKYCIIGYPGIDMIDT